MFYRISNPSDVRDLGEQMEAWIATGNPKAADWLPQPPRLSDGALWQEGQWVVPALASPPPAPEATPLQVRAFLIRQSISLETIPALIASQTAEGAAREEALMRWEYALSFPKDYPLVIAVANALSLDLDQAWASIIAIE